MTYHQHDMVSTNSPKSHSNYVFLLLFVLVWLFDSVNLRDITRCFISAVGSVGLYGLRGFLNSLCAAVGKYSSIKLGREVISIRIYY